MAYRALYRTYRPKTFDEVAGQEHITKTFKNALASGKLSHAYLFSGPRGTGKTSIAKIIAKAINCEQAPTANPCNTCETCQAIEHNTINDVVEIDAASNNGVEEIREIRDKVKYLPGVGAYKVYIIDEVHMLSTGAFNALLKTLEEPPKHVVFILATTEPHKIPATIHSRCQRFDFRGIDLDDMREKLKEIIDKETIQIEDEALDLIAESAEGGMRDAISLLDQVISYSEDSINVDAIHAIRGSVSQAVMVEIAQAIHDEDIIKVLNSIDRLLGEGKDAANILNDLVGFYRDVLLYKNTTGIDDKRLFSDSSFQSLASSLSNPVIFHYMDILSDIKQQMRFATKGKLYLELAAIKMVDEHLKSEARSLEKHDALQSELKTLKDDVATLKDAIGSQSTRTSGDAGKTSEGQAADAPSRSPADDVFDAFENDTKTTDQKEAHIGEETSQEKDIDDNEASEESSPSQDTQSQNTHKQETSSEDEQTHKPESPKSKEQEHYDYLYKRFSQKKYKTFDIRFVEDVLNTGDRQTKIEMTKKWYDIERFVDEENMKYAKMITDGTLVATNGVMLIVTYESPAVCNRLMKIQIKRKILDILEAFFGRKVMFLALPESVWNTISKEFIQKFKNKSSPSQTIELTPIDHPRLVEIPDTEEAFDDMENESVKEAKDLFGDNIVKVKKGE